MSRIKAGSRRVLVPIALLITGMNTLPDDSPASLHPRVVFVELRGPAQEVAKVQTWIEERALYCDAATVGVFGDQATCHINVVVDQE